jgi:hypothetical protein
MDDSEADRKFHQLCKVSRVSLCSHNHDSMPAPLASPLNTPHVFYFSRRMPRPLSAAPHDLRVITRPPLLRPSFCHVYPPQTSPGHLTLPEFAEFMVSQLSAGEWQ